MAPFRPARVLAALALVGLLGACTSGGGGAATGPTGTDPTAVDAFVPTPTVTAGPSPTQGPEEQPVLVLQPDGLGLLADDDSVAPLMFGVATPQAVQDAVESTVGTTVPASLTCPQGPRTSVSVDGFTVLLDGQRFVGWTDAGAADGLLTTAEGVGIGSKLSDLASAYPDLQVAATATGGAWSTPAGLSGTAPSADPTAAVTSISGGETCPAPVVPAAPTAPTSTVPTPTAPAAGPSDQPSPATAP